MSRVLLATLFSSVLVLNAWSATATAASIEPVRTVAAGNQPALPPGGAAGIKKAQGLESGYWREAALVIGAFVVLFLLIGIDDDDHDDVTPTTGT